MRGGVGRFVSIALGRVQFVRFEVVFVCLIPIPFEFKGEGFFCDQFSDLFIAQFGMPNGHEDSSEYPADEYDSPIHDNLLTL